MEAIFFYILAAMLVLFSLLTVMASNPVRSAVFLAGALISMAGLFLLLEAEFLAAAQILVYVGGIMVLFLFVILLVSVRELEGQSPYSRRRRTGLGLAVVMSALFVFLIREGTRLFETRPPEGLILESNTLNTEAVGEALFRTYLLPFEVVSLLLLVAMIGAVVLSKKEI